MDVLYEESAVCANAPKVEKRYKVINIISKFFGALAVIFAVIFLFNLLTFLFFVQSEESGGQRLGDRPAYFSAVYAFSVQRTVARVFSFKAPDQSQLRLHVRFGRTSHLQSLQRQSPQIFVQNRSGKHLKTRATPTLRRLSASAPIRR